MRHGVRRHVEMRRKCGRVIAEQRNRHPQVEGKTSVWAQHGGILRICFLGDWSGTV